MCGSLWPLLVQGAVSRGSQLTSHTLSCLHAGGWNQGSGMPLLPRKGLQRVSCPKFDPSVALLLSGRSGARRQQVAPRRRASGSKSSDAAEFRSPACAAPVRSLVSLVGSLKNGKEASTGQIATTTAKAAATLVPGANDNTTRSSTPAAPPLLIIRPAGGGYPDRGAATVVVQRTAMRRNDEGWLRIRCFFSPPRLRVVFVCERLVEEDPAGVDCSVGGTTPTT